MGPEPINGGSDDNDGRGSQGGGSGERFVFMRSLNAPPRVLLSALSSLRAEHTLSGSQLHENLAEAAQKYPLAKSQFSAPVAGGRGGKVK